MTAPDTPPAAGLGPLRIASVEAIWLHAELGPGEQHVSSFGLNRAFDTTLVRIRTSCGLIGHGEARASAHSSGGNGALCAVIEQDLAPQIIGRDARDISAVWDLLYNGPRAELAIARGQVTPILTRRGLTICGISGIDMALWDILGQSLGAPVWRLLGGRRHERMPAYASGGWAPASGIGAELRGYVERGGFRAVKMRVSPRDGSVERSAERVHAARAALGPDIALMMDAHGSFNVAEAKRLCRLVEGCNIGWFEEPVTADNKRGMAEVRAATDIPIAAGEAEFTRFDFRDLIEARAVDIVQPDVATSGGITEALRIEALASTHLLRFAAHIWAGAPAFSAGLQVSAAVSSAFLLEFSLGANPMLHGLCLDRPVLEEGHVLIPDRPGLGLRIDEDFVARHRVDRGR